MAHDHAIRRPRNRGRAEATAVRLLAILGLGLLLAAPAAPTVAQSLPDFVGSNDDLVRSAMQLARDSITAARLPDGSTVPPETVEELARPIVPTPVGKRTLNTGMLSGYAQFCGLDWRSGSFAPFMEAQRRTGGLTGKQMAYLGILHGIGQGIMLDNLSRHGNCTPEMRGKIAALLK